MEVKSLRSEHCLLDLAIDEYIVKSQCAIGEGAPDEHVRSCSECQQRVRAFESAFESFPAEVPTWGRLIALAQPADVLLSQPRAKHIDRSLTRQWPAQRMLTKSHRSFIRSASLATFMLTIALVIGSISASRPYDDDRFVEGLSPMMTLMLEPAKQITRQKGGVSLGFYVLRARYTFEASPEDPLYPGDRIRFDYRVQENGYFAILSRDDSSVISTFFSDGPHMAKVTAQQRYLADESVELDSTLGNEHIYGIFCRDDHRVSQLREDVSLDPLAPKFPRGCLSQQWTFRKLANSSARSTP